MSLYSNESKTEVLITFIVFHEYLHWHSDGEFFVIDTEDVQDLHIDVHMNLLNIKEHSTSTSTDKVWAKFWS